MMGIGKGKLPLNMVILGIYVRFLGCKHRPFLLAPQRKRLEGSCIWSFVWVEKRDGFLEYSQISQLFRSQKHGDFGMLKFPEKICGWRNQPLWVCICNILWPLRDSIDPSCVYMIQVGDFSSNPMDPLIILKGVQFNIGLCLSTISDNFFFNVQKATFLLYRI